MKFRHYYASATFPGFDVEQPSPESLANHTITQSMIEAVLANHASGNPPYYLRVPRSILHEAHGWFFPASLLVIAPLREEDGDTSALATAHIFFEDTCVFIHARRCLPAMPPGRFKQWHEKAFPEWGNTKC